MLYRALPVPVNVSGVPVIIQDPRGHDLIALNPSTRRGYSLKSSELYPCSKNPDLDAYICLENLLLDHAYHPYLPWLPIPWSTGSTAEEM